MDMRSIRHIQAIVALRLVIAGLLAAHGWTRFLGGGVVPFGEWLEKQGIPGGLYVAAGVTAWEIVATLLLAIGWRVPWLCAAFIAIYATGAVMVHLPQGWFVVGAGRNGMEYSALLIACLAILAYTHGPKRAGTRSPGQIGAMR
jgi:putative oxidoreductase